MTTQKMGLAYVSMVIGTAYWAYSLVVNGVVTASIRHQVATDAAVLTKSATDHLEAGRHPIAIGADRQKMQRAYDTLTRKAALPGEAARANAALHVAMVSVAHTNETFAAVQLEIESLSKAGVLLVTDTPVEWRIIGANATQRAKIGIESRAPVLATGIRQGMLAGLRIQGFGVREAIGADSIDTERGRFCSAMASWQKFFGLSASDVEVWTIHTSDGATLTAHDGGIGGAEHVGSLRSLCG